MASKTNYVSLGLFVIGGIALLTMAILALGLSTYFEAKSPAETYFNESVQGLDVGAPVKYRGVTIGSVSSIGFVTTKYRPMGPARRYVLVEMQLQTRLMDEFFGEGDLRQDIKEMVERGLRVRLTTQGLTGLAFLELNFFDPGQNPPPPIDWQPRVAYIPSAPSTMSRLESMLASVGQGLSELRQVDVEALIGKLDSLLAKGNDILGALDHEELARLLTANLTQLERSMARINQLLSDPALTSLPGDAAASMAALREILERNKEPLGETILATRQAAGNLADLSATLNTYLTDPKFEEGMATIPETMASVRDAAADIQSSAVLLDRLMRSLSDLMADQRPNIDAILEELRLLTNTLNSAAGDARQNPSRLIFGGPPGKPEFPLGAPEATPQEN